MLNVKHENQRRTDVCMKKFIDKLKNNLQVFGVNRAIAYGVFTRIWSVIAGPLTIILIAAKFSKTEQGYYYTYSSLLALQIFFELGLTTVLAQFAAHEFAFLKWGTKGNIIGDKIHREKFIDILVKAVKWYVVSAVLLILILIPIGLQFFSHSSLNVVDFSWKLPWVFAVIGISCNLLLVPFYAVITGSGDVAAINFRMMIGGVISSVIGWFVIAYGGGLYAIPAISAGSMMVGIIYLYNSKSELLKIVFLKLFSDVKSMNTISWWGEIWPMQWKIALSWISGYFIFQLYTPILFKYHGPIVAGQMGMTLSVVNSVQAIALMWLNTKSPEFCKLIAKKEYHKLNQLFNKALKQSIFACFLLSLVLLIIFIFLQSYTLIGSRFLTVLQVGLFLVIVCSNVLIYGWATYMRAHKEEPLLWYSVIGALLTATSTYYLGVSYSSIGMACGSLGISLVWGIPSTYYCFKKFKERYV